MTYYRDEKGALLFLVLFLVSALMIAGAVLLQNSLIERTIARNYELKIRAHYIAETGAEVMMLLLNKQPDYFLQRTGIENPVYLKRGEEEEYFVLQWLEPGNPEGNEEYYTIISSGYYRHLVKGEEARALLRAFVELIFEDGTSNDDRKEGAADHDGDGGEDDVDGDEGGNLSGKTVIEAKIISWSGW